MSLEHAPDRGKRIVPAVPLKPILVSMKVAAGLLGVGPTKMWQLVSSGVVESVKIGAKRLPLYSSLEKLAAVPAAVDSSKTRCAVTKSVAARRARREMMKKAAAANMEVA